MEPSIEPTKLYEKVGRTTFECTAQGISYRGYRFDPDCRNRAKGGPEYYDSSSSSSAAAHPQHHTDSDDTDGSSSTAKRRKARNSSGLNPITYWKAQALLRGLTVAGRATDVKKRVMEGPTELTYTLKMVEQRLKVKCAEQDRVNVQQLAETLRSRLQDRDALVAWDSTPYRQAVKLAALHTRQYGNKLYIALSPENAQAELERELENEKSKRKQRYNGGDDGDQVVASVTTPPESSSSTSMPAAASSSAASGSAQQPDPERARKLRERTKQVFSKDFDELRLRDIREFQEWHVLGRWIIHNANDSSPTAEAGVLALYAMSNSAQMQIWSDFQLGGHRGVVRFANGSLLTVLDPDGVTATIPEAEFMLPSTFIPSPQHHRFKVRTRTMSLGAESRTFEAEAQLGEIAFGGHGGKWMRGLIYMEPDQPPVTIAGWRQEDGDDVDEAMQGRFDQLASLKCRPDIAWLQYSNQLFWF